MNSNKILFLLTKKFPYSHQETYIFDELPFLIEKFEKIIIIPYDEYDYNDADNRLGNLSEIEVLKINHIKDKLSIKQKTIREFSSVSIIIEEFWKGRDRLNQIKNLRASLIELRHLYFLSIKFSNVIKNYKFENEELIFYNYWLHRGVILSYYTSKQIEHNFKIVSRAHAYDLYHKDWLSLLGLQKLGFLPFEYFKIKSCFKVLSISQHGKDHFLNLFKKFSKKFEVQRLGVKDNFKMILHTNSVIITIVSCAFIEPRKRLYMIPKILSHLDFDFKWLHIGSGEKADVDMVVNAIHKYNLQEKCTLMGQVKYDEIINFYKETEVDLFINLSTAEGIPVSLMEAASFSIPMIATKTVGNPEIVDDKNGILIDVDFNPKEVADKLNFLFSKKDLVLKKRTASRETFLKLYNAEKNYTVKTNYADLALLFEA